MNKLVIFLVLLFTIFGATKSQSCVCIPLSHKIIDSATIVFSGILESYEVHPKTDLDVKSTDLFEYRFRVGQVWKGSLSKSVTVYSDDSSCRAHFVVGQMYFVGAYAKRDHDTVLMTSQCSSSPLGLALEPRFVLVDPIVIDPELAAERPNKEELLRMSESDDRLLVINATRALDMLEAKATYSEQSNVDP
jgi:hypothetical protein